MSANIYVGNLSYDITEKQLEELFRQHGEVISVKIITDQYSGKSKGFGFIEMTNSNEAETAIQQIDGKQVLNRNLKVNIAKPRNDTKKFNR